MFLAITSDTWLMTGMGIGVVFVILVLLVFVLQGFSAVAERLTAKPAAKPVVEHSTMSVHPEETPDADRAAIATAVYLYLCDQHDEESGTLTIAHNELTAWHAELNHYVNYVN